MKLRVDLLEHLTTEDILEDIGYDIHRWSAEPVFGKTGVGHLLPATEEDKAAELARADTLTAKLLARAEAERAGGAEPQRGPGFWNQGKAAACLLRRVVE